MKSRRTRQGSHLRSIADWSSIESTFSREPTSSGVKPRESRKSFFQGECFTSPIGTIASGDIQPSATSSSITNSTFQTNVCTREIIHQRGRRNPLTNITNVATNLKRRFDNVQANVQHSSSSNLYNAEHDTSPVVDAPHLPSHHEYVDEGDPDHVCYHCGANIWFTERAIKGSNPNATTSSLCCAQGKVELPLLQSPPSYLQALIFNNNCHLSKHFRDNIRAYNTMFSFTSMGGKIQSSINSSSGPYTFLLCGQNYHRIGSLLPIDGSEPKFAQLYIYDTAHETTNRLSVASSSFDHQTLDPDIVEQLMTMLNECNPFVKSFRMVGEKFDSNQLQGLKLRLLRKRENDGRIYNLPTSSEVAALIVGDFDSHTPERDIIIETQSGDFQRISELHPAYLPMQYPLLFPYGEDGYRDDISHRTSSLQRCSKLTKLTIREFLAFRLMSRGNEVSLLLHAGRLFQQFIVDGYTMIESQRLNYIRYHQKQLRVDLYKGLSDALLRGDVEATSTGKRVILPSSFTGGARYMIQNYQDGMAICRWAGYPDLFLTFTCNPKWPEIKRFVERNGLRPEDRPDIMCRIFKLKLQELMRYLKETKIFGPIIAEMFTIEFQKRGLPHAHILLFLAHDHKFPTPEDLDNIICAEIPDIDTDPLLYDLVKSFMLHGPCGAANPKSPCMKDSRCSKSFPKRFVNTTTIDDDGYPIYRRRNDGRTIQKSTVCLDNRFVVPYNANLLKLFQAHLNVEKCNQSRSIKYLFKYISKGNDRVIASLYAPSDASSIQRPIDEIKQYYDCRYISACEACWRIFAFDIHHRKPSVERLTFHLPNEQPIVYQDGDLIQDVLEKTRIQESMFLAWMSANNEHPEAKNYTYVEFPMHFVFNRQLRKWTPRKQGFSIGRLHFVPPTCGELYYLRILLNKVRGATSFTDIRTVGHKVHNSYREACYDLGLLEDDQEFIEAINEASVWGSGKFLRSLFASMLFCNSLSRPDIVWMRTSTILSEDLFYSQLNQFGNSGIQVSSLDKQNAALLEIENLLRQNGRTLNDFPSMPVPTTVDLMDFDNRLILEQLSYNTPDLHRQSDCLISSMNAEQRLIFHQIIDSSLKKDGKVFFVYGYGGTGKTFLWNALTSALRSKGKIVLTVASSGIASILLPGGRTAHSRFAIPIAITEDSTCNIKQGSAKAELLRKTALIIWDEAPMVNRHCFEALDRSLCDIMQLDDVDSCNKPFGGKSFVMGGDFRQILPVIPKGTRADIVLSSINSSYLWSHCHLLTLTQNMRLQQCASHHELKEFSEWVLKVGDGRIGEPHDGEADIELPKELLITDFSDPLTAIVNSTYPSLVQNFSDPSYLRDRAILAPTIEIVDRVNHFMLSQIPGSHQDYFSSDTVCKSSQDYDSFENIYTPEFLNTICCSGLAPHKLTLKVGVPVMLIRNIDQSSGLCNGTRLITTQLGKHVIQAEIMNGSNVGQKVFIPRINMSPSDSRWPFKLQRRQFPLILSFAMTINKSQGQSLANVGLYLPKPVFTHGQLYVAISRVKSKHGLKILIHDSNNHPLNTTKNVVFKEVFQNLNFIP